MGVGDLASPVDDSVGIGNPVPTTPVDVIADLQRRVAKLEQSGSAELARAVRFLFDDLGLPYPPP